MPPNMALQTISASIPAEIAEIRLNHAEPSLTVQET